MIGVIKADAIGVETIAPVARLIISPHSNSDAIFHKAMASQMSS